MIRFKGKSESSGIEVPCEHHKRSIVNTIMSGVDETIFQTASVESNEQEIEYLEQLSTPFEAWLSEIIKSVDEAIECGDDGDRDNVMYKPIFSKDFIRLCKILPLWTGICCNMFEIDEVVSSSANIESDFDNLKQSLADIIPCSVDVFVEQHIDLLKGATIDASQQHNYVKFIQIEDDSVENSSKEDDQNDDQNRNAQSDDSQSGSISPITQCKDGGEPGGAHRCIECKKAVHILPCCSISTGDEEGYGEKRICNACAQKNRKQKLKHYLHLKLYRKCSIMSHGIKTKKNQQVNIWRQHLIGI